MTAASGTAADPMAAFWEDMSIQAELDVRSFGLNRPEAVDFGMEIWTKGFTAGIAVSRSMLDESMLDESMLDEDSAPTLCASDGEMPPWTA